MRTLRLVTIAAEAEGVRLREHLRRTLARALLTVLALGFLAAAVVLAHIAAWYWLRTYWTQPATAGAIGAVDLVIAALLAVLAARLTAGPMEREALAVRRQALAGAVGSPPPAALATRLVRLLVDLVVRARS